VAVVDVRRYHDQLFIYMHFNQYADRNIGNSRKGRDGTCHIGLAPDLGTIIATAFYSFYVNLLEHNGWNRHSFVCFIGTAHDSEVD
jgi:hypothetical protein